MPLDKNIWLKFNPSNLKARRINRAQICPRSLNLTSLSRLAALASARS
ncbi:hypothetical protein CAMSH0001_1099 [Campylobacter showae RM3277]|uniref:Uncharacterized protein n=1 Tax=Campylobacter showae RM3277 TaxID=553219 RepID=C6RHZ0_9BACT|nr:hypothetical protein CAMSH0001_1099 [Campylobacter showae RM3277]